MKILASLFLFLFSLLLLPAQTPGALDPSFASVGYRIDATSDTVYGSVVRIMQDGRIVTAGISESGPDRRIRLFRYLQDGSLDTMLAHTGTTRTVGPTVQSDNIDMAVQADGKILVYFQAPATYDGVNVLGRFNGDGTIDSNFGQGGWALDSSYYPIGYPSGIAIQQDGKILIAGAYSDDTLFKDGLWAQRYLPNGAPDLSYGVAGTAKVLSSTFSVEPQAAILQPDGKFLVFGQAYDTVHWGNMNIVLARFDTDGMPDATFGSNGIMVDTQVPIWEFPRDIAVGAQGEIYVMGENPNSSSYQDINLAQFSSNGTLNTSFGTNGWIEVLDPTNDLRAMSIEMATDGTVLIACIGSDINGNAEVPNLIHFLSNFSRDPAFGLNGISRVPVGPDGLSPTDMALQADGKIVTVGTSQINWRHDRQTIARFEAAVPTVTTPAKPALATATLFPNPNTGLAQLRFELLGDATVSIVVTDLLGRTVAQPVIASAYAQGIHACGLDISGVPAGSYLVRLVAGDDVQTLRVVVAR